MDGTRLIDEATRAKLRMTPEEANAVVEMWAVQNRIAYDPTGLASPIPSGLVLPPQEVRLYLNEVRGLSNRKLRPARSIGADVRLAIIAASVLLIAALGFALAFGLRRSPSYAAYAPYRYGPLYSSGPPVQIGDLRRTRYLNSDITFWLTERSSLPVRFVFANDQYFFEPIGRTVGPNMEALKDALTTVVGGPLAENSQLSTGAISAAEISRALSQRPQRNPANPLPPNLDAENLIEWKSVKVAYGGKIIESWMPYAKVSDKALRDAVLADQARTIGQLAEGGVTLAGPVKSFETPAPPPTPRASMGLR